MIANFRSSPACVSRNPQNPISFQPDELSRRNLVLLLRPLKQPHELRPPPNGIEPRIVGHGRMTKDPAGDYTLEELQCGIDLVQVSASDIGGLQDR